MRISALNFMTHRGFPLQAIICTSRFEGEFVKKLPLCATDLRSAEINTYLASQALLRDNYWGFMTAQQLLRDETMRDCHRMPATPWQWSCNGAAMELQWSCSPRPQLMRGTDGRRKEHEAHFFNDDVNCHNV